ncbi:MAG: MFS transporter [Fidelibacterota bacterium]
MSREVYLTRTDHRRNLILNSVHEMFWGFGMAFHSTYAVIPLFLKGLGAPDVVIASVAGVFVISAATPQIITAFLGQNIRNLKFAVVAVHGLPIPAVFLAGFIFTFLKPTGPSAWTIYYVCYLLFTLGLGIVFPIWADFLETAHRPDKRGSFFGISFAFNFLAGSVGGLTVKNLLASPIEFPANFGYGFLIYAGCILVASLLFIPYRTTTTVRRSETKTFRRFMKEIRGLVASETNFRRYITSRILLAANYPAIPLYAAYSYDKLQFHMSEAGIFTAITVIVGGLWSYVTGQIGDRFGHKRALVMVFTLYFLALVTAIRAETLTQTYLIFVFLGMAQGGFWTSAMSLIYEFAGKRDKKIYFALVDSLTAPFVLLFIILSGILIPLVGVPTVLKGIGVFLVLGIISLSFFTREPRIVRRELPPPESIP